MQVMQDNPGLSKEQLVDVLHGRGYVGVTLRQVTDWRSRDLLPPFDIEGVSLGRAQGKSKSRWSNGVIVIEQSAWIIELLNLFGDYRHVYVPLWLLGYPVHLGRVREALSEPLERTISSVQRDCTADKNMEDVLSEDASILAAKLEKENSSFQIPVDALDLILNLFMNPDYDLTDEGAFQAFQVWQEQCQRLQANWSKSGMQPGTADSIESLLEFASIVQQYLSIREIKRCVDEATYEDLRVVERDITILRRTWSMLSKLVARELPADLYLPKDVILRLVLGIGRIAIYLDISLRSHGDGGYIDTRLPHWLAMVERAFNEKFGEANCSVTTQAA